MFTQARQFFKRVLNGHGYIKCLSAPKIWASELILLWYVPVCDNHCKRVKVKKNFKKKPKTVVPFCGSKSKGSKAYILWMFSTSHIDCPNLNLSSLISSTSFSDYILLNPTLITMKEDQIYVFGGVACPETYLGTRMNEKALLFHTQLHDWSDAQNLAHSTVNSRILNSNAKQKEIYLPVKKLTQIEYWTRDVNKYYHPKRPATAKSGSFMYIDVSKYKIKDTDNSEILRPKSAVVGSSRPGQRATSAITTNSVPKRRFFGTDVHTIHSQLVESQFHYSALRKNIYSSKPAKQTIKTSDPKESLKTGSMQNGFSNSTYESETTSTIGNSTGTKQSDLELKNKSQGLANPQIMQPVITSRSWSNKMLNVISIDDCKLTCRYRPQKIKEARGPNIDYEEIDRKKHKASKRKTTDKSFDENQSDSNADADDENESDVDIDMNDIHLSPDRNNNEITHQIIITEATPRNDDSDSDVQYLPKIDSVVMNKNATDEDVNKNIGTDQTDNATQQLQDIKDVEQQIPKQKEVDLANKEIHRIMDSQGTASKTSYGRITTLYSNSDATKQSKPEKQKKTSRTQRINHAIDNMIGERKVMNAMTKDFDKRISEFGRTIIDKQEGSDTFKKMHSKLRKKMDQFMEHKGAMKTKQFFERQRSNSNSISVNSGLEKL